MKKFFTLLFPGLLLLTSRLSAQISLEQNYPSSGMFNTATFGNGFTIFGAKYFYMIKLEVSGEKYVAIDLLSQTVNFYNLNHSLYTSISYSNVTMLGSWGDPVQEKMNATVFYFSEKLFDTDDQIEFMYCNWSLNTSGSSAVTHVLNEDGTILFTANGEAPLVKPNYHNQFYPIYNTAQGTKMILSKANGSASVYSLGGTFSGLVNNGSDHDPVFTVSPNPVGKGQPVTLSYDLPAGLAEARLTLFDSEGKEIKSYRIGAEMNTVVVEPGELPQGIYYYSIFSGSRVIDSKKSVVVEQ